MSFKKYRHVAFIALNGIIAVVGYVRGMFSLGETIIIVYLGLVINSGLNGESE